MKKGQQAPKPGAERLRILKHKDSERLKELIEARQFYVNKKCDYLPEAHKRVIQNIDDAIKSAQGGR